MPPSEVAGVNRSPLGFDCKRSMDSIPRLLLRESKVLIDSLRHLVHNVNEFDTQTTFSVTQGFNWTPLGSYCKSSTDPIPRCLLRNSRVLIGFLWVSAAKGRMFDSQTTSSETEDVNRIFLGSLCKKSTDSISRRLVRKFRVLIGLPSVPGAAGRRFASYTDSVGNLRC